ncbi:preprotein translocase subunit SecA [Paludicola sp. MB14-C6]|uniref:preprotein translocase subunit SecA n=1 Tax=Paludihabitans sp. MB14-C6 TaxID=3070656 RepID=UPI0027DB49ED|nr:preprotein translocase subunit SecA [Paludicola sp. MB14-C6]WMJ23271.1 preprotein translocase subunit SecA [Paludicola sp. MB14-C6]
MSLLEKIFGSYSKKELKKIEPIQQRVLDLEKKYQAMSSQELQEQTNILKQRLEDGETLDQILPDAFAVCREASWRVIGIKHFPVQIIGGIILHQGRIAEMKTGEGKTFVAMLPAYLNALNGKGVHVVTVNEYLAKYQSEWVGKVYKYLGLSVGLILHDMSNDEKRAAYNSDITYATNNELGFDYLRDNMVIYKKDKVQRDFVFAIVDEVDSILIDEARTPLIISGPGEKSTELYSIADKFASRLKMHKVVEQDTKQHDDDVDADYIVDEKAKTATLTPSGVKKAESFFNIENLMDAENLTIQHHINQAIKAHGIMKLDVEYVVKDGEVLIVDEFTGRIMVGRRFSEGLHQAIEAKEGVQVARESKTLATITFQNFFRLYEKLSGMTGTALTEEAEFNEIYKLDIVEVPTNKPCIRTDYDDAIYKTELAKYNAVIDQIVECHKIGQPVLVGTVSIDKSELLSSMLKRRGIKHEVLNAKQHDKEAEIVAQAGKKGAVTIATNMAGRGTDIMLGGNADYLAVAQLKKKGYTDEQIALATSYSETDDAEIIALRAEYAELNKKFKEQIKPEAEAVCEAGGLFIIGTERHESRRIDNQLRGRAGRQGDPGCSRFYISLEDDLMRLFGGERIQGMMTRLNVDESQSIENKLLTNTIESAQRKVEGRNFSIRKNVLKFDDVMNTQRTIIYGQRAKVLNDDNLSEVIQTMIKESITQDVCMYLADNEIHDDWNMEGLRDHYLGVLTNKDDLKYTVNELADLSRDDIINQLLEKAKEVYAAREKEIGEETMRELERVILLKNVDSKWVDHIDAMDELKKGIHLRAYGQHDPVIEYRTEGFDMFDEMIASIRHDTVRMLLTVKLQNDVKREQVAKPTTAIHGESDNTVKRQPIRKEKIGSNDPCPCGSGKKYKKCCGINQQ